MSALYGLPADLRPRDYDPPPVGQHSHTGTILVVDDEALNRILLAASLQEKGHTVLLAEDGEEALRQVEQQLPDIILLDIMMPGLSGFDVLEQLQQRPDWHDVAVIVVSATDDLDSVVRCIQMGAVDHLAKPFNPVLLNARIGSALAALQLHRRELEYSARMALYNRELEARVDEQTEQLQASLARLGQVLDGTVFALASLVERRDPYTAGHQRRVSELAIRVGQELALSADQLTGLHVAGVLHDVGKVCVPAEILCKPGRLSPAEFGVIAAHPMVGYDILKGIEFPWPVADIVVQHHEKIDGSGYPAGLKGDEVLTEAQIIGVCDIVEAVAYHRPYRPALGMDVALSEVRKGSGHCHLPEVVEAAVAVIADHGFEFSNPS